MCAVLTWVAYHLRTELQRPPTKEEVVEHLHKRASECLPAFMVLQMLMHLNLILQLSVTEETNGWREFKALYPVMGLFSVITNSTNYMVIIGMEILRWLRATMAADIFMANFGFTKLTKNGARVFCDKHVEHTVKHTRRRVGKKYRAGVQDKLAYTVRFLPELVELWDKQDSADGQGGRRGKRKRHRDVPVQDPFFHTYSLLNATNIFGQIGSDFYTTPARNPDGVKQQRLSGPHAPGTMRTLTGEFPSMEWIRMMSLATRRQDVLHEHLFRGDEKADLTSYTPSATAKGAAVASQHRWVRTYSTKAAEILSMHPDLKTTRVFRHEDVVTELKSWRATRSETWIKTLKIPSDIKSDEAAALLVRVRMHVLQDQDVPEMPRLDTAGGTDPEMQQAVAEAMLHPLITRPIGP